MSSRAKLRSVLLLVGLALSFRARADVGDADGQGKVKGLPDDDGCPVGMVLVDGESCWEVRHTCLAEVPDDPAHRCLEFAEGKDECIPPKKRLRFCMDRYEWPGTPGAKPRVIASYFEAEQACRSLGKRMCDEQEFYLACEGPEHWPFAWGHVRHPSTCNIDRPYLSVDWTKWGQGGEARLEEARRLDQALPIGTTRCFSPYGIHDVAGNVDEWTHAQKGRELLGSLNGGYWGPVPNACRYVTLVHGPEFSFYQIGFRCCADAK
jgi:sulfatase modifying factor 1